MHSSHIYSSVQFRSTFFWVFAACAAVLAAAAPVNASVSETYIAGLGTHIDHHNDASVEYLDVDSGTGFNTNGTPKAIGQVDEGDVFQGMFLVDNIGVLGGTIGTNRLTTDGSVGGIELTGLFRTKVLTKTITPVPLIVSPTGFIYTFTFGPDTGSAFTTSYGAGAMGALFEDAFTAATKYNPSAATTAAALATASGGTLQAVIGFAGLLGEGWQSSTITDVIAALPSGASTAINNYAANLNYIGAVGDYTALSIPFAQASSFALGSFTQFSVSGQVFGNGGTSAANFPVGDSTDIFFNVTGRVVPEPTSFLVWIVLAIVTLGIRGSRSLRRA